MLHPICVVLKVIDELSTSLCFGFGVVFLALTCFSSTQGIDPNVIRIDCFSV